MLVDSAVAETGSGADLPQPDKINVVSSRIVRKRFIARHI
jgi:hypothetical protein